MRTNLLKRSSTKTNPIASLLALIAACVWLRPTPALAAESAVIQALRQALQPAPSVWGEVRVGEETRAPADPRAMEASRQLRGLLAQRAQQPDGPPPPAPVQGPAAAIAKLRQMAGPDVEVLLRPNGTARQIRGAVLSPAALGIARASELDRAEGAARKFLRDHRALLNLDDPDLECILESSQRGFNGSRHLKFALQHRGVPLWPAGLNVHLDPKGNVNLMDGAYIPTPRNVDPTPSITPEQAAQKAKALTPSPNHAVTSDPLLIIYSPLDQEPRLAWKMDLTLGFMHAWKVVIDAHTSKVLSRVSQICAANAAGAGNDLEGISRNINVWAEDGKFFMADTTKPMFKAGSSPVNAPQGVISIFDARQSPIKDLKTVYLIESASAASWLPDGISALYNFSHTYDYFLARLERNSLDGQGGNIQAVVRIAQMDNAFWNGNLKMMFFGDVRPYPAALDVVGHELAHGVTQHSADLVYELQPGAMNESFSDIFGEMVEARVEGRPDWKMGSRLGKIFRDMKDPGSIQIEGLNRPYPSKMSEFVQLPNSNDGDHGGVHINSSILNRCFYLLAEGLPGAIGLVDAEKIFYRCLSVHLQKQSQFVDARLGCLASAENLFGPGSVQVQKTAEAFDAVEIFATPSTPAPSPIPVVPGEDSTLFVAFNPFTGLTALGRREAALGDPSDGIALAQPIKSARPSVSGDGATAVFVSGLNDLCAVNTDNPNSVQCLGLAGFVHSVALSPDARLAAFVLRDPISGQADNRISVYDFIRDETKTFELLAPVMDGSPVDAVLYADSMIFTSDSQQLIYDAVSEIRLGGAQTVQRWSIFRINLPTESTTVLVPPLAGVDFGNPNIGRAGNRYLTFDANETATGEDIIINLDLFTGDFAQVGSVGKGIGFPCFNGDETAVIYAARDPNAFFTGYTLVKQDLTPDRLGAAGQPTVFLPDASINLSYRRGAFVGSNHAPVATLTSPASGSSFSTAAQIQLQASATDDDGTISKVEFYSGSAKLGEDASAPYQFTWTNPAPGAHRLIARAIDNLGATTDSAAALIQVQDPNQSVPPRLSAARLPNGRLQLTVAGSPGDHVVESTADLKTWTELSPITLGGAGIGSIEDPTSSTQPGYRFYRARRK